MNNVSGRVLIIVQNLPVPQDRRVWLEATSLARAGYEVSVIAIRGSRQPLSERREGVRVYRYPAPLAATGLFGYLLEFSYCWFMAALLSLFVFLRHGLDVIHACNPPDSYFVIGKFFGLLGKRFVYDQHDLCPEMYQSRFGRPAPDRLYRALRLLERWTYAAADIVICPNESYRRISMARGHRTEADTVIVRSGPSLATFNPVPVDTSLRRGFPYLVVYVGVIGPQDGVANLIHALHHLVYALGRHDTGTAILGSGDALPEVRRLTAELGLDRFVEFPGWSETPTLLRYLSAATLCVLPDPKDPYSDQSTQNKIVEYMALGRPIVAFDLTEARRSAGAAALFVEPNDPTALAAGISHLLDRPDQRDTLGRLGRERFVRELAWEHSEIALVETYRRLLSERRG